MKSGKPIIYWDTCVFIAWLKDEKDKWPPAIWQGIQDVADLVQIGQAILVTSTLIRTEVFLGTLTLEQKQKFASILRRKNVQEVAPHMRITDRASTIREKHKIKTPDAIHLATAILYDVDEMQTMDGWHEDDKRDGLLALSGNVAEYKLWITEPYPRGTPSVPTATPPEPFKGEQELLWKDILEEELESEGDQQNGTTEENNELQADPTHPIPVRGSHGGRAESEAAGEAAQTTQQENQKTEVKAMFNKGDYVRHRLAPNTRLGTIEGSRIERGHQEYLFRQDKRFTFESPDTSDFYVLESEIETCQRPTDAEVEAINRLTEAGS